MMGLVRIAIVLAMLPSVCCAQIAQDSVPVKSQRIVTNGELSPSAQFHLLLIYQSADTADTVTNKVTFILTHPQSQMRSWAEACNVRMMHAQESAATEHHADLLQKHGGKFPILALIEHTQNGKGAVWCSAAGQEIPTSESGLASWLGSYYKANLEAAQRSGVQPSLTQNHLPLQIQDSVQNSQGKVQNDGSYFMPRNQAPEPVRLPSLRGPLINPQFDVAIPDALETSVGLQDGAMMGIGAAVVAIVCSMILAYGRTQAAQIHANAITDDPDDEKVAN
jgi:hypothetical protein